MTVTRKTVTINIQNIPCYCSIGIDPKEKKLGQRLLIDVYLEISSFRAVTTDNVKDTISYVDVYKAIQKIGKDKSYSLIETLADEIAETFLKHPLVLKVRTKISKPHIPYPDFEGSVSVEVEREK
ncbi:MAG: dihydroneopterin aldolase [Candidatus Melainabacteria bacterium]|nr:dihydroneopterin aldolase [Candidatus Melainabacteria bacterium]